MCDCVKDTHVIAGWACCVCNVYNGLQRTTCRACARERCHPLLPTSNTGERFETYEEAYANDPDLLSRIKEQLVIHARSRD